jgi:hypothetical protein
MITHIETTATMLTEALGATKAGIILKSLTPCKLLGHTFFDTTEIEAAIKKVKEDPSAKFDARPAKLDVLKEIINLNQKK